MAQIAQQDNLVIVANVAVANLGADVKKKLLECAKNGTIFDVILQTKETNTQTCLYKVLTLIKDATDGGDVKYKLLLMGLAAVAVELN